MLAVLLGFATRGRLLAPRNEPLAENALARYVLVAALIILGAAAIAGALAFALRRSNLEHALAWRHLLAAVAMLAVIGTAGYLLAPHTPPHLRKDRGTPCRSCQKATDIEAGRRARAAAHARPTALWDELAAGLLAAFAAGGYALLARRRHRQSARASQQQQRALIAEVASESLDDLRTARDLRRAIIAAYARMERALASVGLQRNTADAPFEYLSRMLVALGSAREPAERLTTLFERAKFSQHGVTEAEREEAVNALGSIRGALAG